jgi:hypothetical protein
LRGCCGELGHVACSWRRGTGQLRDAGGCEHHQRSESRGTRALPGADTASRACKRGPQLWLQRSCSAHRCRWPALHPPAVIDKHPATRRLGRAPLASHRIAGVSDASFVTCCSTRCAHYFYVRCRNNCWQWLVRNAVGPPGHLPAVALHAIRTLTPPGRQTVCARCLSPGDHLRPLTVV